MILSGQDFPLERLQQQPDIRHPLELARTLDGGIPISPAVIVGEGEMVYPQMLRPDGLFDEVTALPKSHPREVQKGQINGAVADEIPQLRVRHGAVSGDQDPETVIFQDTAVVGDLPVLCTLVSQAHEVHVQPLQGEMAAGTGQHQLAVKLLLRQHQGHLRISGNHLLCQGAGVMVRMAVGEKEQIRAGEVRMSLKNVPALRGDSGEPHNPMVVERVGPDPHGTQMQGDPGVDAECDLAMGHDVAPCVYRYVFHSNFAWSEELVINVFILMIMLGCALATRDGSMITLSLIFDNVGVGGKKILTVIDTVVNLIFYAILIYTGFNKVFDQISTGKETFSLGWPEWVFTILLPIGSIFLVLHAIEYLVDVMSNKAACVKPAETEGGKETV